jgi:hypothetical protein
LLLLLGGAMTAPRAFAQQKAIPVVGYLGSGSAPSSPSQPLLAAFHQG